MRKLQNGLSKLTWDDVYFDGLLDSFEEDFCEDTQEIVKLPKKLDWEFDKDEDEE